MNKSCRVSIGDFFSFRNQFLLTKVEYIQGRKIKKGKDSNHAKKRIADNDGSVSQSQKR